jgi:copper transport protein
VTLCRRLGAAAVLLLVALAWWSDPAGAHATLVSADPADGSTIEGAPSQVTLQFNEPVVIGVGGVDVLDAAGQPVQDGEATAVDKTVSVDLPTDLPDGTYVVSYRVTSADGHPITGATIFGIGVAPDAEQADVVAPDAEGWGFWAGVGRAMSYAGSLLAGGAAVFLVFVADPALPRRSFRWVVPGAAVLTVLSLPVLVVAQAARASGLGWDVIGETEILRDALAQGLGWQCLLLFLAAVAAVVSVRVPRPTRLVLAAGSVLATATGLALWGHPRAAEPAWLAMAGDALHVAAGALWFGGLVLLSWVLLARLGTLDAAANTVSRFSVMGGGIVVALLVGGSALAYAEIGSLDDVFSTTYGRLTASKVGVVGVVLALAAWNRFRMVPAITAAPDPDGDPTVADPAAVRAWSHLRRTVTAEAVLLVAVLGITTVLVEVTPPVNEVAEAAEGPETPAGGPFHGEAPIGDGTLTFDVNPGVAGPNTIHLSYIGADGALEQMTESVTLELELPSANLGPIERELEAFSEGHYIYEGGDLSIPGEWTITVVSRVSRFEEERSPFQVPIG